MGWKRTLDRFIARADRREVVSQANYYLDQWADHGNPIDLGLAINTLQAHK